MKRGIMDISLMLRHHGPEETCVDCGLPAGLQSDRYSDSETCVDCGLPSRKCPHWSCPKIRRIQGNGASLSKSPKDPGQSESIRLLPAPPQKSPPPSNRTAGRRPSASASLPKGYGSQAKRGLLPISSLAPLPNYSASWTPVQSYQAPPSMPQCSSSRQLTPASSLPRGHSSPGNRGLLARSATPPISTRSNSSAPVTGHQAPTPMTHGSTGSKSPPTTSLPHGHFPPGNGTLPSNSPNASAALSAGSTSSIAPVSPGNQTPLSPSPYGITGQQSPVTTSQPNAPSLQTIGVQLHSSRPSHQTHSTSHQTPRPPQIQSPAPLPTFHHALPPAVPLQLSLPTIAMEIFLPPMNTVVPRIDLRELRHPTCGRVILGSGAFGTVQLETFCGNKVAVKYMRTTTDLDRLPVLREARAMGLLSGHPSFPFFFGLAVAGHHQGLVMEFIGNSITGQSLTLADALEGPNRLHLAPSSWCRIALDVLDGLRYMHDRGLLHNDLKTDNILVRDVGGSWRACIIDVGLCTLASHPRVHHLTSAQKARWRRYHVHIAPELVEDAAPQTQLSDVFQMGLVLYFIGLWGGVPSLIPLAYWCLRRNPQMRPSTAVLRLMLAGIA